MTLSFGFGAHDSGFSNSQFGATHAATGKRRQLNLIMEDIRKNNAETNGVTWKTWRCVAGYAMSPF